MSHFQIRVARAEDAAELLEIYRPYVENTAITFEYEVPSVEEFAERIRTTLQKYPYLAAVYEGQIVGYAYASAFKERAAYDWSIETSVYVRQDRKRMGIGRALYAALDSCLYKQHILNLNACIAYPEKEDQHLNADSVHFHEKLGYSMVGEFHQCGYKFGTWYNMVWMEKMLGEHTGNPLPVLPFEPDMLFTVYSL